MKDLEIFISCIFKLSINKIIIALLVIITFYLLDKFFIDFILKTIFKLVKKTTNKIDDSIICAINKPIKLLVFGLGIYFAVKIINIDQMPSEMLSSTKYLKILLVITFCAFLYNLTLQNAGIGSKACAGEGKVVFPFVAIIVRLIIIVFALIIVASEFGLTGFLTGLGVSSVVVALAAQDTCANLFGGMMIVLDKPFSLGDWIRIEGVEGIVEEITFRSTRIRTFCNSLVTVPNSTLTGNNIVNCSKREKWRISFKITLDFETKYDQIEIVKNSIDETLHNTDGISDEILIVRFNEISAHGYTIFIYFYTDIIDFYEYEKLKEKINFSILKILDDNNVVLSNLNLSISDVNNKNTDKKSLNKKQLVVKKNIWKKF